MASYKEVIDVYVQLQSRKPQAGNAKEKKKQSQIMLLLVLLSLLPHTFLYFVLIVSYAEKKVPSYNSISLKICFQLSRNFMISLLTKFPQFFKTFYLPLKVKCSI